MTDQEDRRLENAEPGKWRTKPQGWIIEDQVIGMHNNRPIGHFIQQQSVKVIRSIVYQC